MNLIGPLKGERLLPRIKWTLVEGIGEAVEGGMSLAKACRILGLRRGRLYEWTRGKELVEVTLEDLIELPPGPEKAPHGLLEEEVEEILKLAQEDRYADLRYRKLAYQAGLDSRVHASPSSFYRVMKAEGLISPYQAPKRRDNQRPSLEADGPNQVWCWDITYIAVAKTYLYLVAIIDRYSRKITGWWLNYTMTQQDMKRAWESALENEGLLEAPAEKMPKAFSDRGTQMKAKSIRQFFKDLGIVQEFARYRTPEDNCFIETWFKTVKYEKLYREELEEPLEVKEVVAGFIDYYNHERLHQGIGFVTPAQRHAGLDKEIIAKRKEELKKARQRRIERSQGQEISSGNGQKAIEGDEMIGIPQRSLTLRAYPETL